MSDNEDYMSDKLLQECAKRNIRPGLLFKQSQKRALEQHKKKLNTKKSKTYKEQEREVREIGLNTALPSSNVGFKLLQKMGYKEGESLGKNTSGIKEPVTIIVKETSSGVGREKQIEEVALEKQEMKSKILLLKEQEFRQAISERNLMYISTRDYYKLQKVCEELDFKNKVSTPKEKYFWTRDTIQNLNKSGESENSEDSEPLEEITDEKIHSIIDYLRSEYLYCLYCGFCSANIEELNRICPGSYRSDHDEF